MFTLLEIVSDGDGDWTGNSLSFFFSFFLSFFFSIIYNWGSKRSVVQATLAQVNSPGLPFKFGENVLTASRTISIVNMITVT